MDYVIEYDEAIKNIEGIEARLKALYSTRAGTQPMDRDFGLDLDEVTGMPPEAAQNTLAVEITGKTRRYVPETEAESVTFTAGADGRLLARIHIRNSDDIEEEDEEDEQGYAE